MTAKDRNPAASLAHAVQLGEQEFQTEMAAEQVAIENKNKEEAADRERFHNLIMSCAGIPAWLFSYPYEYDYTPGYVNEIYVKFTLPPGFTPLEVRMGHKSYLSRENDSLIATKFGSTRFGAVDDYYGEGEWVVKNFVIDWHTSLERAIYACAIEPMTKEKAQAEVDEANRNRKQSVVDVDFKPPAVTPSVGYQIQELITKLVLDLLKEINDDEDEE